MAVSITVKQSQEVLRNNRGSLFTSVSPLHNIGNLACNKTLDRSLISAVGERDKKQWESFI